MDRGAWLAIVHGVTKESDTTEHLHATNLYLTGYETEAQRHLAQNSMATQWLSERAGINIQAGKFKK